MYRIAMFVSGAALLTLFAAGCQRGGGTDKAKKLIVPVAHPEKRSVADYAYYTGRTNAMHSVTIQPRVTGYLMEMPFKEGEYVKKDATLFKIDPRPYEAQLKAALAQLAQSKASLEYASATYKRFKELDDKAKGNVSPRELDQYKAQESQAIATLNLSEANLESAKLNLEWTEIKSPIDGHISRYYLTKGNLVNQDVTQLTTVVSMDPMYVYFDMDEPTLLTIKRAVNEGKLKTRSKETEDARAVGASTLGLLALPLARRDLAAASMLYPGRVAPDALVEVSMAGEDDYRHVGKINFVDNQVNSGTGSISIRGVFDNPKPAGGTFLMVPGMFVRVRLPIGERHDALLVTDKAITSEQGRKKVFVLDDKGLVQEREVTVGALQDDGLRVISRGLKQDDWVLVGGLQQVRPGMEAQPEEYFMPLPGKAAIPLTPKKEAEKKPK